MRLNFAGDVDQMGLYLRQLFDAFENTVVIGIWSELNAQSTMLHDDFTNA